jgi:aminoglycoside phosphotransferase (APT) family kinase protein
MINDLFSASIAAKLGARDLEILEIRKNIGGMSADIFFVNLLYKNDLGEIRDEIVIRREPEGGIQENYDYAKEYKVLDALWKSGVPVPQVLWYEGDKSLFVRPFYAMKKVDGDIQKLDPRGAMECVFDCEERVSIGEDFVKILADLHNINWQTAGLEFMNDIPEGKNHIQYEIEMCESAIERSGYRNHPMRSLIFNMMKANMPTPGPLSVVHGDYRTGNFVTNRGRIKAVLDWELCHLGDPHEDLAYVLSPVWRSAGDGLVNHLMTEEEFIQKYEELSGRKVDRYKLLYFGILNGIRSLEMMTSCAKAFASSGKPDMRDGIHCTMVDLITALTVMGLMQLKESKL